LGESCHCLFNKRKAAMPQPWQAVAQRLSSIEIFKNHYTH